VTGENWVLLAAIAAWTTQALAKLTVRARQQYRRDQAKGAGK
jgi:hypothetical protein